MIIQWWQTYRVKKSFIQVVSVLIKVQKTLFGFYQRPTQQAKYALALHKLRQSLLHKVRFAHKIKKNPQQALIFTKINHLIEITYALHLLRFRILDPAIYEICAHEMQELEKTLSQLLRQWAKNSLRSHKNLIEWTFFVEKIHAFEAIYQRTLQVVAPDPLVFSFFIQDLYALSEETQHLV